MVSERCGKQSKLITIIQYIPENREAVSDFFCLLRYWLLRMEKRKGKVTLVKSTLAYTKAVKLRYLELSVVKKKQRDILGFEILRLKWLYSSENRQLPLRHIHDIWDKKCSLNWNSNLYMKWYLDFIQKVLKNSYVINTVFYRISIWISRISEKRFYFFKQCWPYVYRIWWGYVIAFCLLFVFVSLFHFISSCKINIGFI